MSNWKPLSGRVSLIASATPSAMADSVLVLYQKIWGTTPMNFQQAQNPLMPSTAQGEVAGMIASCSAFANRVDFNFSPKADTTPNLSLRLIDQASLLHRELSKVSDALGSGSLGLPPELNRAAMFVQFVSIEPTVVDANKAIVRAIPAKYRLELNDEEAFVLQVRRPIWVERLEKAKLNVVTKWSVEQFNVVSFGMAVGAFPGAAQQGGILPPQIAVFFGASVSFDCATETTKAQLNRAEQAAMLARALMLTEDLQRE